MIANPRERSARVDKEWDTLQAIFALPALANQRPAIMAYVDPFRRTVDWPGLEGAAASWSHGEQVLVRLAQTLWSATDLLALDELRVLDPDTAQQVLAIIQRCYWG
jgi:ATPase subunit of ABC transporter with duplicated ATPase domains